MPLHMSDIAAAAGVSRSTVSRVLSGKAQAFRISAQTAARIMKEAQARGYRVSQLARSLRTSVSHTLGLIVSDISNPFFAQVAWAAEQAAEEAGFATLVGSSGEDPARERAYVENLRSRGVDGLLVAPAGGDCTHLLQLKAEGFPFVLLDRELEGLACDAVGVDNPRAARSLCALLLARGARRIAFLGGRPETSTGRERLEGYRTALRARRMRADPALVVQGDFSVASGRAGAEALLRLPEPPDAIFCVNNKVLCGCLERLAAAPREPWARLPVASFDETPFLNLLGRPLAVAAQPERQIGARAVQLLIRRVLSAPPGRPRMRKPYARERLEVELKTFGFGAGKPFSLLEKQ